MLRPRSYKKYVYWLPAGEFRHFQQEFERIEHKTLFIPERYPCELLSPTRSIGAVLPETWNMACNRQGSWYRTSEKAGQVIVVSAKPFPLLQNYFWGEVSVVSFHPPKLPSEKQVRDLVKTPAYISRMPEEWPRFLEDEKVRFRRFFDSKGISLSLDEVLLHQSANHANFLQSNPNFAVLEKGKRVPYSIMPMLLTCCACHEIFGVLGAEHPKKYIMRCPGLKFVDLAQDEYFLIESIPK
jgi:hypothetical protein